MEEDQGVYSRRSCILEGILRSYHFDMDYKKGKGVHIEIRVRLSGRNVIHVRFISRSYRIRGNEARTLMKMVASKVVFSISM